MHDMICNANSLGETLQQTSGASSSQWILFQKHGGLKISPLRMKFIYVNALITHYLPTVYDLKSRPRLVASAYSTHSARLWVHTATP